MSRYSTGEPAEVAAGEHPLEVGVGEAELLEREQRMRSGPVTERIEIGDQVAELAERVDQVEDADHGLDAAGRPGGASEAEFVAGEDEPPGLVDALRVLAELLVEGGDVIGVRAGEMIDETQRFSPCGRAGSTHPGTETLG
jgi:hypothetical protein